MKTVIGLVAGIITGISFGPAVAGAFNMEVTGGLDGGDAIAVAVAVLSTFMYWYLLSLI